METVIKSMEILGNITRQISSISESMQSIFKSTENQIKIKSDIGVQIDFLQTLSSQIKISAEEQKNAFQEIVKGITEVSTIAQSTASAAEQVSGNSGAISQLSKEISETVGSFRTE